jgi:hypothetical protein
MAVIQPTFVLPPGTLDYQGIAIVKWENVTSADTCGPVELCKSNERSVQVVGTFGTADLNIEGSHDGTNFSVLLDANGVALTLDCSRLRKVDTLCRYARPALSGADGTTSLTVYMMFKGIFGTII